ncbi:unnamed protein product [Rhizoctonia solani]|uniref:L-type lectin-like domain-containing protein n=1 Tax=Rhizoctonia solani TaxID=456999 RepID=A0A8H3E732_9AGAM|nr:unnamed protein product [Rhizoctonia solani]
MDCPVVRSRQVPPLVDEFRVSILASAWLVQKHLKWYSCKHHQRLIIRLLFFPPIYASITLASYVSDTTYLFLVRDVYASIVLASFFSLVLEYLAGPRLGRLWVEAPASTERAAVVRGVFSRIPMRPDPTNAHEPLKWIFPFCLVPVRPKDGLAYLDWMKWGVLQYCIVRPGTTLAAVILEQLDLYCESSWNWRWGHVYVVTIASVSAAVAMYSLIQLYTTIRQDLKHSIHSDLARLSHILAIDALGGYHTHSKRFGKTIPLTRWSIVVDGSSAYVDQDLQNRWFSFGGSAYVNTNKHIRLTRDKSSQAGWLWSRLPLTASNYQIIIEFKASSVSGGSSHLYGDGFAIWLTDTRAQPGPVFGSVDNFVGLGIFIDTYANSRHTYAFPRIMGMLGDGKTSYDLANDGASNELAACSANVRKTDIATKLKLTYFRDEYLNVQLQYKGWDEWTECFTVYDVSLPNTPYLGFTAHTGDVADNHDIVSISTASAILTEAPINKPTKQTTSSSGFWTFLSLLVKLAGVALFGVAALAGYRAYARNAKRRGGGFGGLGGGVPHWDNKHF